MNNNSNPTTVNSIQVITPSHKSTIVAYLFLIFLGYFGIHRFYLGQVGLGLTILILNILGWITLPIGGELILWPIVGIWLLIDLFTLFISVDKVNQKINKLALQQTKNIMNNNTKGSNSSN